MAKVPAFEHIVILLLRLGGAVFTALWLSACQLHDINFDPEPSVQADAAYHEDKRDDQGETQDKAGDDSQAGKLRHWWKRFDNPKLNALVDTALKSNLDIATARARLKQARAVTVRTQSRRWPQIDIEGRSQDSQRDGTAQEGFSEIGAALDWELDVFNRIGAQAEADRLEAAAREAGVATARLRVSAEVARTYYGAVAQARQLDVLRDQVKSDREFVNLTQRRFDQGIANKVDVLQAKGQLAETRSRIPGAEAELGVLERRLDVLLGQAPDGEKRITPQDKFVTLDDIPPIGVPSDLLLNRPDLRTARHDLVAADAEIAAAIAERLPQFTLDGSYLLADGPGFAGPVASISAMVVQPLLDWGQRRAQVRENEALYQQRLAEFTQRYITAIGDVENALERERRQRTFIDRTRERRNVLSQTLQQTRSRFQQGITDYLPVLDAVEELQVVERELVRARRDLIERRIELHRALGGLLGPRDTIDTDDETGEAPPDKPDKGE